MNSWLDFSNWKGLHPKQTIWQSRPLSVAIDQVCGGVDAMQALFSCFTEVLQSLLCVLSFMHIYIIYRQLSHKKSLGQRPEKQRDAIKKRPWCQAFECGHSVAWQSDWIAMALLSFSLTSCSCLSNLYLLPQTEQNRSPAMAPSEHLLPEYQESQRCTTNQHIWTQHLPWWQKPWWAKCWWSSWLLFSFTPSFTPSLSISHIGPIRLMRLALPPSFPAC